MDDTKVFTQEQKTESLRKALIEAGYDMASSQAESMEEDTESVLKQKHYRAKSCPYKRYWNNRK